MNENADSGRFSGRHSEMLTGVMEHNGTTLNVDLGRVEHSSVKTD